MGACGCACTHEIALPECESRNALDQLPLSSNSNPQVKKCAYCWRPPAAGFLYCCASCKATNGREHGPECEAMNAAADNVARLEKACATLRASLAVKARSGQLKRILSGRDPALGQEGGFCPTDVAPTVQRSNSCNKEEVAKYKFSQYLVEASNKDGWSAVFLHGSDGSTKVPNGTLLLVTGCQDSSEHIVQFFEQGLRVKRYHVCNVVSVCVQFAAFCSHSKKRDYAFPSVRDVQRHVQAHGYEVFVDYDHLVDITKKELAKFVACSSIFLLFMDDLTLESEWCRYEVLFAAQCNVPIHVIINVDQHRVELLIDQTRRDYPDIARRLFGADSKQVICYSLKLGAQHEKALSDVVSRIDSVRSPVKANLAEAATQMLAELKEMNLKNVKQRALEIGCDEKAVKNVDEADNPKQAVIDLILLKMKAASPDADPKQLAELKEMNLKDLKERALGTGCDEKAVEDVDEADDLKRAVIDLILSKMKASALRSANASALFPGARVRVADTQLERRSRAGGMLLNYSAGSERWGVKLDDGQELQIKPEYLMLEVHYERVRVALRRRFVEKARAILDQRFATCI